MDNVFSISENVYESPSHVRLHCKLFSFQTRLTRNPWLMGSLERRVPVCVCQYVHLMEKLQTWEIEIRLKAFYFSRMLLTLKCGSARRSHHRLTQAWDVNEGLSWIRLVLTQQGSFWLRYTVFHTSSVFFLLVGFVCLTPLMCIRKWMSGIFTHSAGEWLENI